MVRNGKIRPFFAGLSAVESSCNETARGNWAPEARAMIVF